MVLYGFPSVDAFVKVELRGEGVGAVMWRPGREKSERFDGERCIDGIDMMLMNVRIQWRWFECGKVGQSGRFNAIS